MLQEMVERWGGGRSTRPRQESGVRVHSSQLGGVLLGLGLGDALATFEEAGVGLEEFLVLREGELEGLGLGLGARKRILAAQGEIHRRDWERGSLPSLQREARKEGLMVSMVDVATMLANIAKHGRLMRASLGYLRLQAEDHGPRLARVGGDLVPVRQLLQGAADATAELHLLAAEAGLLEGRLAELPGAGGRAGGRRGLVGALAAAAVASTVFALYRRGWW